MEVALNLSSNLIATFNDEPNFLHKLLLTDTQVSILCQAFENSSSANITFWKAQLSKMKQSGGVIRGIPIFGNILSNLATKGTNIHRDLGKNFLQKQIDKYNKGYITAKG